VLSPWERISAPPVEGISAVPSWTPDGAAATQLLPSRPELVTILLVEDDAGVRSGVGRFLHGSGYQVVQAATGSSALQRASGLGPELSLALIDLRLPDMLGDELWRRLNRQIMGLRTLFISGYPPQDLPVLPLHRQEVSFLAKPFELTELDHSITELLATR